MSRRVRDANHKIHSSATSAQDGSIFTEAALVIPVLLIVLLGFIDFFRYQAIKTSLSFAAQSALSNAVTVPGLEELENLYHNPNPIPTTAAIYKSLKVAKDQFQVRAFGASLKIRDPGSGALVAFDESNGQYVANTIVLPPPTSPSSPNLDDAMSKTPIKVTLTASIPALMLPFLQGYPVTASAVGYRERRQGSSNPVYTACDGLPFDPNRPPVHCNCQNGRALNTRTGRCECPMCPPGASGPDENNNCACTCPNGMVITAAGCACSAASMDPPCAPPLQPVTVGDPPSSCACECPAGQGDGVNCCPSGQRPSDGHCCPIPSTWNVTAGECQCPTCHAPFIADPASTSCGCMCPTNIPCDLTTSHIDPTDCLCKCNNSQQTIDAAGHCQCQNPPTCNPATEVLGPDCQCHCNRAPNGATCGTGYMDQSNNCNCRCDNVNYTYHPPPIDTCLCSNGLTPADCTGNTHFDASSCQCVCNACTNGATPSAPPNCACNCAAPNPPCTGAQVPTPDNCACICPTGHLCADGTCTADFCEGSIG